MMKPDKHKKSAKSITVIKTDKLISHQILDDGQALPEFKIKATKDTRNNDIENIINDKVGNSKNSWHASPPISSRNTNFLKYVVLISFTNSKI